MPGFVVSNVAVMTCPHGGKVTVVPTGPPRVLVSGGAAVTATDQLVGTGCTFGIAPCVKGQGGNLSSRVVGTGLPVLLQAPPPMPPPVPGNALCAPTPAPPLVLSTQLRVIGT